MKEILNIIFPDLRKGTEYQVRISALTVNGSGITTPWQSATTYRDNLYGKMVTTYQDNRY